MTPASDPPGPDVDAAGGEPTGDGHGDGVGDGWDDDDDDAEGGGPSGGRLRLDKWLWFARFFKTRSLAARVCNAGVVRCSGVVVGKAHFHVRPGDVLTFPQGRHIRVIRVATLGTRRGPAEEARLLYDDLAPPSRDTAMEGPSPAPRHLRPVKRDRRATERAKGEI